MTNPVNPKEDTPPKMPSMNNAGLVFAIFLLMKGFMKSSMKNIMIESPMLIKKDMKFPVANPLYKK